MDIHQDSLFENNFDAYNTNSKPMLKTFWYQSIFNENVSTGTKMVRVIRLWWLAKQFQRVCSVTIIFHENVAMLLVKDFCKKNLKLYEKFIECGEMEKLCLIVF